MKSILTIFFVFISINLNFCSVFAQDKQIKKSFLDHYRNRFMLIMDENSQDPEMLILQKIIQEYLDAFHDHNVEKIVDNYLDNAFIIPIDNEIIKPTRERLTPT